MRFIKHIVEYSFLRTFVFSLNLFPYPFVQRFAARLLGFIGYHLGGSRRELVRKHLEHAFPELDPDRRGALLKEQFRTLGYIAAEFVKQPRFDNAWMERYVTWEPGGVAFVERCLSEGQGVLVNGGHIGNWEALPRLLALRFPAQLHAVGANVANPLTHRWMWNRRRNANVVFHTVDQLGAAVIKALKGGGIFALASDQSATQNAVFVPFLGRPAATHTGASQIAYLSGAQMVFVMAVRLPEGRFRVELVPIGRAADLSEDRDEAIRLITLRYVDLLEKYIRRYPEQYFWVHNRWKRQPQADSKQWERIATELEPL